MCGRYYVDDETAREIEKLVGKVEERLRLKAFKGDIYPSKTAPVITAAGQGLEVSVKRWGFPGFEGNKVIFNARAESALEKRMFSESLLGRRCMIPASHFYEWNKEGEKYAFERKESPVLYMAGFYKFYEEEDRFVILTTKANSSVKDVHDRMPLILEKQELEIWLEDGPIEKLLKKEPAMLDRYSEYEQQSLW